MLIVGSDDGAYRVTGLDGPGDPTVVKTLDAGPAMRVRVLESVDGVLAAATTGLYHSADGERWTDLGVPEGAVYTVGASPDGERLYAGTRPAGVYTARVGAGGVGESDLRWRELDAFQELPSRDDWRLPRHENLAQVRDVRSPSPSRVVAGVEVGGVHLSDDDGETWTERCDGCHDDVHELLVVTADEWVAATGYGLYRTADAGRTWTRLDGDVDERYFRSVAASDGVVYASGAAANSATWDDPDSTAELFAWDGDSLDPVALPTDDEVVTGLTTAGETLVVGTHRGTLLARRSDGWVAAGAFPVSSEVTGRYTPLASFEP